MQVIQATPEHANEAHQLIYLSGPVSFEHIFNHNHGPHIQTFLNKAFTSKKTMFSHQHHYVIESHGIAIATIGLFTRKQHDSTFLDNAIWIWRHYGIRSIIKGLTFEYKLVKAPRKECLYLCHIAVNEAQRGKGIASKLVSFAEQEARSKGIETLSLDVAQKNITAINTYLKLGFKQIRTNHSYNAILDNHIYMEKRLS